MKRRKQKNNPRTWVIEVRKKLKRRKRNTKYTQTKLPWSPPEFSFQPYVLRTYQQTKLPFPPIVFKKCTPEIQEPKTKQTNIEDFFESNTSDI
jgi:hypothetical protein